MDYGIEADRAQLIEEVLGYDPSYYGPARSL